MLPAEAKGEIMDKEKLALYVAMMLAMLLAFTTLFFCDEAQAAPSSLGKPDHVFRFNPHQAKPVSREADSDGRVPEYVVCGFRALGRYSWHRTPSGEVEGVIRYNICAHARLDHRVREWRTTIEHERLHALGYRLGE